MSFNLQSTLIATGSMDNTAKLWDVQKGMEVATLTVSHLPMSRFNFTLDYQSLFSFLFCACLLFYNGFMGCNLGKDTLSFRMCKGFLFIRLLNEIVLKCI